MSCSKLASKLAFKKRRQRQTREGRCRISNCDLEIVSGSWTSKYVHLPGIKSNVISAADAQHVYVPWSLQSRCVLDVQRWFSLGCMWYSTNAWRDSVQYRVHVHAGVGLETCVYWMFRANSVWGAGDRTLMFGATQFNASLVCMRVWA